MLIKPAGGMYNLRDDIRAALRRRGFRRGRAPKSMSSESCQRRGRRRPSARASRRRAFFIQAIIRATRSAKSRLATDHGPHNHEAI